jgi:hypothetical protein
VVGNGDAIRRTEVSRPAGFIPYRLRDLLSTVRVEGVQAASLFRPPTAEGKVLPPGTRSMLIRPHLPLSIRLLNRIFPEGGLAHAVCVPYTPEAAAAARASGHSVAVLDTVQGELKAVRS